MKLTIELVPKTSWFSNLRDALSQSNWDKIKYLTAQSASRRCEICNGVGNKWPVECHEVWDYDDVNHIQKLVRTIALCPTCHAVKHIGYNISQQPQRVPGLIRHLAKVNNITINEAEHYVVKCFKEWEERSKHAWTIDVNWLRKKFPNMEIKDKYKK